LRNTSSYTFNPYRLNNHRHSFLVTLHIQESLDLRQCQVLPITHADQFVKRAQQLKSISQDFSFIKTPADARDNLGEEM